MKRTELTMLEEILKREESYYSFSGISTARQANYSSFWVIIW